MNNYSYAKIGDVINFIRNLCIVILFAMTIYVLLNIKEWVADRKIKSDEVHKQQMQIVKEIHRDIDRIDRRLLSS
jgi:hypothetical protein